MVYEQEQIKEIAEEVKRFMLENRLAEDFIKHISGNHNKGELQTFYYEGHGTERQGKPSC